MQFVYNNVIKSNFLISADTFDYTSYEKTENRKNTEFPMTMNYIQKETYTNVDKQKFYFIMQLVTLTSVGHVNVRIVKLLRRRNLHMQRTEERTLVFDSSSTPVRVHKHAVIKRKSNDAFGPTVVSTITQYSQPLQERKRKTLRQYHSKSPFICTYVYVFTL